MAVGYAWIFQNAISGKTLFSKVQCTCKRFHVTEMKISPPWIQIFLHLRRWGYLCLRPLCLLLPLRFRSRQPSVPSLDQAGLLHLSEACTTWRYWLKLSCLSPIIKGFSESCDAWESMDFLLASHNFGQLHCKKCYAIPEFEYDTLLSFSLMFYTRTWNWFYRSPCWF
jgi:hypothetical protein